MIFLNNGSKLSYEVLNKFFTNKINKTEILFLLFAAKRQEETGIISGLHYKEMNEYYRKKGFVFSYQSFYSAKESLVQKNIIKATSSQEGDWNIVIIDNDYSSFIDEDYRKMKEKEIDMRYINVNSSFFETENFIKLSAGAMLLAIDLYKQCIASSSRTEYGTITRNVNNFYEKYRKKLQHYGRKNKDNIEKRVIQNYLKELKKFFNIHIKNGNYKIKMHDKFMKNINYSKELTSSIYIKHVAKTIIRRLKMRTNDSEKMDLEQTIFSYVNKLKTEIKQAKKDNKMTTIQIKNIVAFKEIEKCIKETFKEYNHTTSEKPRDWNNRSWRTIKKEATKRMHNKLPGLIYNC